MAKLVGEWTTWGDDPKPVVEGTEKMCKGYVEQHPERNDLYVTDPAGNEWVYENGKWDKA
jgi:hypothetical protein